MKILMLSGAYKNAGDFLIVERSRLLLKHFIPDCEIETLMANEPLEDKLEHVNRFDWLVFPGGLGYLYNYYPDFVRLTENLSDIKPRMLIAGMGWQGVDDSDKTVEQYRFSSKTIELFQRVLKDCGFLGCRDNYSVRVLKNSGLCADRYIEKAAEYMGITVEKFWEIADQYVNQSLFYKTNNPTGGWKPRFKVGEDYSADL